MPRLTAAQKQQDRIERELVCCQCPLNDCDEGSLFCAFRWATNPNAAQLKVILRRRKQVTAETLRRREYFAERYRATKG